MDWEPVIRLLYAITTLLIGLILSSVGIYLGLYLFQMILGMGPKKKTMNWQQELKSGNHAVAVLLVAIIIAIALVIQAGLRGVGDLSQNVDEETFLQLIYGIIQICIGIVISIVAIYVAVKIFDGFTREIDEFQEIKDGNVAVALVVGGIIVAIAFVVQAVVSNIVNMLQI